MNNSLITIIIPVYNIEKYLRKCIESVIEQTYKNIEIILVDDGSMDNSGEICDQYKEKDSRILVIHKRNGGLSDARNSAIDIAKGKYLFFLDGDDYIEKDSIEYLYNIITKYKCQIAIAQTQLVWDGKEKIKRNKDNCKREEKIKLYNNESALEAMLYNTEFTNNACNKLYDTKLFTNIRYPIGMLYEDLATTYKLISLAKKIVLSSRITYNYLVDRNTSIMNSSYNSKRMQSLIFTNEIISFVKEKYPSIELAAISRMYMECLFILLKLPYKKKYSNDNKIVHNFLKKYRWKVIKNKKLPIKQKLLCIVAIGGRVPLRIVWDCKEKIKRMK